MRYRNSSCAPTRHQKSSIVMKNLSSLFTGAAADERSEPSGCAVARYSMPSPRNRKASTTSVHGSCTSRSVCMSFLLIDLRKKEEEEGRRRKKKEEGERRGEECNWLCCSS